MDFSGGLVSSWIWWISQCVHVADDIFVGLEDLVGPLLVIVVRSTFRASVPALLTLVLDLHEHISNRK